MQPKKTQACGTGPVKPAQKDEDSAVKQALDQIKHKFLIMSGKGGVGKTSVSVNLAIALANRGFHVGLMDVDIHGPDVPRMLGLKDAMTMGDQSKLLPLAFNDKLKIVSIEGLMQNKDDAIIWRGPVKHSVIRQFVADVAWGPLDYLVIDAPPGTGDEPLTVAQIIPDAQAVIVTTPQEVALADVRKSINFCKTVHMKIAGLIENMSGCICPKCGESFSLFGSGGGERTALASGIRFLGSIPFDPRMVACGDAGIDFNKHYTDAEVSRKFDAVAKILSSNQETAKTG